MEGRDVSAEEFSVPVVSGPAVEVAEFPPTMHW